MNSFSHIVIGRYLHRYLRERHGIKLSWGSFIYGNILPDFRPSFKKLPHEKESWALYLKGEFGKLSALKQESSGFGVNYSRRLGIICHFYSDFFCFAHTACFKGGTYSHVRYEWTLHRHMRAGKSALSGKDFCGSMARGLDSGTIQGCFAAMQEKYLMETPSFETDIAYTLGACIDAVTAIVGNSVISSAAFEQPVIYGLIPDPLEG